MYGIMTQSGSMVLCRYGTDAYVLKRWDRQGTMVMREYAIEIDQLLQEYMVASGKYDLSVFKFTEEQEQQIMIRKLKGY